MVIVLVTHDHNRVSQFLWGRWGSTFQKVFFSTLRISRSRELQLLNEARFFSAGVKTERTVHLFGSPERNKLQGTNK